MSTWPPRWDKPQFKQPGSRKVARGLRREKRLSAENANKRTVRLRDKFCRFPLCGCSRFGLALHVSHATHKGMGGNPAEDRSEPDIMLLVCVARHRENVFSIDRKTVRWRPLTKDGAVGPIVWELDTSFIRTRGAALPALVQETVAGMPRARWFELARETSRHVFEPSTPAQTIILAWLRGMEV